MKKRLFSLLFAILLIPAILVMGGCKKPHEHSYNAIGICECGDSLTKTMFYKANNPRRYEGEIERFYWTDEEGNKHINNTYYFNLVMEEEYEEGAEFVLHCPQGVEAKLVSVEIYNDRAQHLANADNSKETFIYEANMSLGSRYYFRIVLEGDEGSVEFRVKERTVI